MIVVVAFERLFVEILMQLVPGSWSLSRRILYSPPFPPAEHTYASLPFCRISFYAISSCQKISRAKMLFCKLHSSSPSPLPPKKGNRLSGVCRASAFVHKNFSSFPLSGCFILMRKGLSGRWKGVWGYFIRF